MSEDLERSGIGDRDVEENDFKKVVAISSLVAVLVGVIVSISLIYVSSQQSYSALYIYPDSYSNYAAPGDNVTFRYGVISYESGTTKYTLSIYLGENLIGTKELILGSRETFEEFMTLKLPEDVELPVKVSMVLEGGGNIYEVHFWLKEEGKDAL